MIENLKHKFENYKPYINGYKNMKRASVLIPIVKKDDTHHILFQVRSKNLKSQPNEISFPGGKIESNESPLDAVIRETCEELGTTAQNINIISELDLLITPGDMIIHPFVGYINNIDNLNINKDEVDHIFLAPVSYLLKHDPCIYIIMKSRLFQMIIFLMILYQIKRITNLLLATTKFYFINMKIM